MPIPEAANRVSVWVLEQPYLMAPVDHISYHILESKLKRSPTAPNKVDAVAFSPE